MLQEGSQGLAKAGSALKESVSAGEVGNRLFEFQRSAPRGCQPGSSQGNEAGLRGKRLIRGVGG